MKSILSLYRYAEKQNIPVLSFPLPETGSLSVMDAHGDCFIGMDDSRSMSETEERVHLAHELGHCETGSFYSRYTKVDCIKRHENRADKWAIRRLIPAAQLDSAIAAGHTDLWDLADYFGVTVPFMQKAVCWYTHGNVATELYF